MMPIFKKRQATPTATVPIDPDFGDPELARMRQALAAGDWPTASGILERAGGPDDLAAFVDVARSVPGCEAWLPDVIRADLQSTLPLLLYGARVTGWAWDARTGALAEYVSQDQFQVFWERLAIAEDSLQGVVRREPHNATAWYELVIVARGLELGTDEARRRFDEVVARHPEHIRAHQQMLQQLCLKWGGSHEAMHAFARNAMLGAPEGSPLGHLVAIAHLEHWLYLTRDKPANRYLRSRDVLASLHEAANRSVRHPGYRRQRDWPSFHNIFAMAFALAGDRHAAAEQFDIIGDLVTEWPWEYLDRDPGRKFRELRDDAYANRGWARTSRS
jgi:hypothetical protein